MILMLMTFEFHLMWWSLGVWDFYFSLFHSLLRKGRIPFLLSLSQAFANVLAALQLLQIAFPQHPLPSVVLVWTCSVVPCDITA